jgi:hypothetical protein
MTDEEYVRAKWGRVERYAHSGYVFIKFHDCVPIAIIGGDIFPGRYLIDQESLAWSAAKAFTEQREKEIQEVEEEIEVEQGCIESCETLLEIPEAKRHLAAHKRILAVEQDRLKALKAGMREVK